MNPQKADVLIVGAGPVGLFLANELLRHGLNCTLIDKKSGLSTHSKALGIHIRTLEVFMDCGFVSDVLKRGHEVRGVLFKHQHQEIAEANFDHTDAPYHCVIDLPQDQTEHLLAEALAQKQQSILWQTELLYFEQHEHQIIATVQNPDQSKSTLQASWLVACDGAHSTVRHLLNLDFIGSPYQEHWWLADLHIDWALPQDRMIVYLGDHGPMACFPMQEQRYRLVMMAPANGPEEPTFDDIQTLFTQNCPEKATLHDPLWINGFNLQHRQIQQYRHGRVFLAGDAAHIHSPFGGQGLNTGIQDSYNLAWKLALVHKGQGKAILLDSYHVERYPVGKKVLLEADRMTKVFTLKNSVAVHLRNQLLSFITSFDAIKDKLASNMAELLIAYRQSPIVSQQGRLKYTAGQLLPYASLSNPQGQSRSLFELCQGIKHHLLLLNGLDDNATSRLHDLAKEIHECYGDLIDMHWIGTTPCTVDWPDSHWYDADASLHHKVGAKLASLLLIRPDKYVAYAQSPIDSVGLRSYLEGVLGKSS